MAGLTISRLAARKEVSKNRKHLLVGMQAMLLSMIAGVALSASGYDGTGMSYSATGLEASPEPAPYYDEVPHFDEAPPPSNVLGSEFDPTALAPVGIHPGAINYWENPYYANALAPGLWMEYSGYEWGKSIALWENPQFDQQGHPLYLNEGYKLRAPVFGMHAEYPELAKGHVVLAWQGNADIRLVGSSDYLEQESNGAPQGLLANGRRVYRFEDGNHLKWLEVHAIDANSPPTDIKVWLADPESPRTASLEGELWHPLFLERIRDQERSVIRTMEIAKTNANPQQDWSDRRIPDHVFMSGILNPRTPAPGALAWNQQPYKGDRVTGVPYEHLVDLANRTNQDLWINVPHLATDEFVTKLAKLIRYGSDGEEPYNQPVPNPVWAPLNPGLRVFVEYSNEIWSNGDSFPQGDWAAAQGKLAFPALSKAKWNARRFVQVWKLFEEVFESPTEGADELVRVAATWTAQQFYTNEFLTEMAAYGSSFGIQPDVVAVTTYLGNGIEKWVHETAMERANTQDPWFYTGEFFGENNPRPVSMPAEAPYWGGEAMQRHMVEAFDEWTKRLLSQSPLSSAGPDNTSTIGGFGSWVSDSIEEAFGVSIPIIAYEGGPSIYTDKLDGSDPRDDGITQFMIAMNRNQRIFPIYKFHLDSAAAKGLWLHMPFTLSGTWGKYGQWGHLEHLDANLEDAPKYAAVLEWAEEQRLPNLPHPQVLTSTGDNGGTEGGAMPMPTFDTKRLRSPAIVGEKYWGSVEILNGAPPLAITCDLQSLVKGLNLYVRREKSRINVSGVPEEQGTSFYYCKVIDSRGYSVKQVFSLETETCSANPPATIDFEELPLTYETAWPGPIVTSGYAVSGNNGVVVQGEVPSGERWTSDGEWASNVVRSRFWGSNLILRHPEGQAFDLYSMDLAMYEGESARIIGVKVDDIEVETVVNLPKQKKPMTSVLLDWLGLKEVRVEWYEKPDAQGGLRRGVFDNIQINNSPRCQP